MNLLERFVAFKEKRRLEQEEEKFEKMVKVSSNESFYDLWFVCVTESPAGV